MNFNFIRTCPHCGKPMKELTGRGRLIRHVYHPGDEDEWGYSAREAVPTLTCEDCGIKYLSYHSGYDRMTEWVFPKGYKETITPKQEKYIYYLCSRNYGLAREEDKGFWNVPYITNVDLAAEWIAEHVAVAERLKAEDAVRTRVVKALSDIGWKEHNCFNCYHDEAKSKFSEHGYDDNEYHEFDTLISIDWDKREVLAKVNINMSLTSDADYKRLSDYLETHKAKVEKFKSVVDSVFNAK